MALVRERCQEAWNVEILSVRIDQCVWDTFGLVVWDNLNLSARLFMSLTSEKKGYIEIGHEKNKWKIHENTRLSIQKLIVQQTNTYISMFHRCSYVFIFLHYCASELLNAVDLFTRVEGRPSVTAVSVDASEINPSNSVCSGVIKPRGSSPT